MSHHLSNLTWEIELSGYPKLVMPALSHLAVQSTGECSPTVQRLAYMCGMSDSGVRAQLTALVNAGLVEESRAGNKRIWRVCTAKRSGGASA